MVFLFKKKSRGKWYYYLGANKKVHGKSVRAWEIYVGPVEKILAMVQQTKEGVLLREVEVFEFGALAALLAICERLHLRQLANRYTDKRRAQGVDVGTYLTIMVLNRCVAPRSKRQLANWYQHTFLRRHLGLPLQALASQRFWDHMGYFTPEALKQLGTALIQELIEAFDVRLDCLLYDPTNFATYLTPHPDRGNQLPQWGYSKQKRFDLLQVNLALLVTRQDGLPLLHEVYGGNTHDSTEFQAIIGQLIDRYQEFQLSCQDLTLIFDKGNNSQTAIKELEASPYHFIGSLRPSTQQTLLALPLEQYEETWRDDPQGPRVTRAHRVRKTVYGVERTVVVTYHEPSARAAKKTLEAHLGKAEENLQALQAKIGQRGYRTPDALEKKAQAIVGKKRLKGLVTITITGQDSGRSGQAPTLTWQRQTEALEKREQAFGKSVLFTDQEGWPTKEIVEAYRSQWRIERDFRELKDPSYIRATPIYHWTDEKIRVHFFICVLALLLLRLLHRQVRQAGLDWSLERIMNGLKGIKEAVITTEGWSQVQYKITKLSRDQKQLYTVLQLKRYSKEPPARPKEEAS